MQNYTIEINLHIDNNTKKIHLDLITVNKNKNLVSNQSVFEKLRVMDLKVKDFIQECIKEE